jgi:hypothetical protein
VSLTLAGLVEMGAFTGAPVEREIEWKQKDKDLKATVFVRPLSYSSAVSDIKSLSSGDPVAGRIAACICDEKGEPVFTSADITGEADPERGPLDGNLTMELLRVIGEVNGLGKSES